MFSGKGPGGKKSGPSGPLFAVINLKSGKRVNVTVCNPVLERGEEYPSLNLAAPSMVARESKASRSTIPVPLAAYDAPEYSSPSLN